MKIAIVPRNFVYPSGGQEEHIYQIARRLTRLGNEVTVYCTTLFADHSVPKIDIPVVRVPYRLRLLGYCYSPALLALLVRAKPDLIHAQGWGNYSIDSSLTASRRMVVPLIVTPHGFFHEKKTNRLPKLLYNRFLSKRIFSNARMIAICGEQVEYLQRRGARLVTLIPNGIEPSELTQTWRESGDAWLQTHDFKVLIVGRIARYKRFDTAMRAFTVLLKADQKAKLIIAGEDWGASASLRRMADSLGISENLLFTGRIERRALLSLYQSCNVFVSTSSYEGFGIAMLEALASGLPVVTTPVGAALDMSDYVTTFQIGDWLQLGRILVEIRKGQRSVLEMARLGSQKVLTEYTWDRVVAKTLQLYNDALSGKK